MIQVIRIISTIILFIISIFIKSEGLSFIISIIAYLIIGYDVLIHSLKNILKGKIFDEHFLMSIASIGALFIKEYHEALAVMLFYQIGETLQDYAIDTSKKKITEAMDIRPDYANLIKNDKTTKVSPEKVKIGDTIIILPGEKIPLDGIIIEGTSRLNTAALTGEAVPKKVCEQDSVLSGCINLESPIKIKVTSTYETSTVAKIIDLVENASSKKAKSEKFITKFASVYTPIVVILAILIMLIPYLFLDNFNTYEYLHKSLSFLVASCPCALVISIPLSFFASIGACSKQGVLVKGSNYIEDFAKTSILVCDKTGTLTQGVFKVSKIDSKNINKNNLLKIAAMAEHFSNHPIAISIKNAYENTYDEKKITKTKEIMGRGIIATIDSDEIIIGSDEFLSEQKIKFTKSNEVGTNVYIAINKTYEGVITIKDEIKKESIKLIEFLKNNNIKSIMLSGDEESICRDISKKLHIDEYHAKVLPQDKVNVINDLLENKSTKERLVFMGDGINDAPSLATSNIGIAMGGLGTDAAVEAADVVILNDNPAKFIDIYKISKKTLKIVKENICFAILIKVIVLLICLIFNPSMWLAVFADVGVSIIAILNALRVLK